jgi:ribonuclease HIII
MTTHYKTKLVSSSQRLALKQKALACTQFTWHAKPEQYCEYRLDGSPAMAGGKSWVRLKQYTNGTLYVEGSEVGVFSGLMQALGLQAAVTQEPTPQAKPLSLPTRSQSSRFNEAQALLQLEQAACQGSDESGKGDFFGPLVVAGVLIFPEQVEALKAIGVKDCKELSNAAVMQQAEALAEVLGLEQLAVVALMPTQYNQTYEALKAKKQNLNHMLANAHASVLQALVRKNAERLQQEGLSTEQPLLTIVDQFCKAPLVPNALPASLRPQLRLIEQPKAEQYLPVAAASLVARHRFLSSLKQLEQQVQHPLPAGAGPQVLKAAKALVRQKGSVVLGTVAKLHFKTTQQVM